MRLKVVLQTHWSKIYTHNSVTQYYHIHSNGQHTPVWATHSTEVVWGEYITHTHTSTLRQTRTAIITATAVTHGAVLKVWLILQEILQYYTVMHLIALHSPGRMPQGDAPVIN